jgi:S1-C subfamily serine protease
MPSAPAPGEAAGRPAGASPRPGATTSTSKPGSSGSSGAAGSTGASNLPGEIQCGLDGICSVARRDFDAMVADPGKLLRQVSVSEAPGGYKLGGIRSGSQVSQLGFRNGDVLISVNGTQLDDQLGLLGLYGGLATTSSYKVVYERGGARRTKVVRLRE